MRLLHCHQLNIMEIDVNYFSTRAPSHAILRQIVTAAALSVLAVSATAQTTACENKPANWIDSGQDISYVVTITSTSPDYSRLLNGSPAAVTLNDGDTILISSAGDVTPKGPHYQVDLLNGSRKLTQVLPTKPPSAQFRMDSVDGDPIYTRKTGNKYNMSLDAVSSCSSDGKAIKGTATITDAQAISVTPVVQTLVLTRSP